MTLRRERKAKGLCPYCGKEKQGKISRCPDCLAKSKITYRKRSDTRLAQGICTRCKQPLDIPYKRLCKACRDKARLYYQTHVKASCD